MKNHVGRGHADIQTCPLHELCGVSRAGGNDTFIEHLIVYQRKRRRKTRDVSIEPRDDQRDAAFSAVEAPVESETKAEVQDGFEAEHSPSEEDAKDTSALYGSDGSDDDSAELAALNVSSGVPQSRVAVLRTDDLEVTDRRLFQLLSFCLSFGISESTFCAMKRLDALTWDTAVPASLKTIKRRFAKELGKQFKLNRRTIKLPNESGQFEHYYVSLIQAIQVWLSQSETKRLILKHNHLPKLLHDISCPATEYSKVQDGKLYRQVLRKLRDAIPDEDLDRSYFLGIVLFTDGSSFFSSRTDGMYFLCATVAEWPHASRCSPNQPSIAVLSAMRKSEFQQIGHSAWWHDLARDFGTLRIFRILWILTLSWLQSEVPSASKFEWKMGVRLRFTSRFCFSPATIQRSVMRWGLFKRVPPTSSVQDVASSVSTSPNPFTKVMQVKFRMMTSKESSTRCQQRSNQNTVSRLAS